MVPQLLLTATSIRNKVISYIQETSAASVFCDHMNENQRQKKKFRLCINFVIITCYCFLSNILGSPAKVQTYRNTVLLMYVVSLAYNFLVYKNIITKYSASEGSPKICLKCIHELTLSYWWVSELQLWMLVFSWLRFWGLLLHSVCFRYSHRRNLVEIHMIMVIKVFWKWSALWKILLALSLVVFAVWTVACSGMRKMALFLFDIHLCNTFHYEFLIHFYIHCFCDECWLADSLAGHCIQNSNFFRMKICFLEVVEMVSIQ